MKVAEQVFAREESISMQSFSEEPQDVQQEVRGGLPLAS